MPQTPQAPCSAVLRPPVGMASIATAMNRKPCKLASALHDHNCQIAQDSTTAWAEEIVLLDSRSRLGSYSPGPRRCHGPVAALVLDSALHKMQPDKGSILLLQPCPRGHALLLQTTNLRLCFYGGEQTTVALDLLADQSLPAFGCSH
ncbi:hypothetical protein L7F22_033055 [Adiantum nelumboides]|nr:hypothetical protein [Adiantum nelumboides]